MVDHIPKERIYAAGIDANLFVYIVDFIFEIRAWAVRQVAKHECTPAKIPNHHKVGDINMLFLFKTQIKKHFLRNKFTRQAGYSMKTKMVYGRVATRIQVLRQSKSVRVYQGWYLMMMI